MNWNDLTLNPKVILGYYEAGPSLKKVDLHRVSLLRDGPTAEIVFEVDEFPQKPSPRWPSGANACQITLRAIGLCEVELRQWGTGVSGELEIKPLPDGIKICFSGEGAFRFKCSHVDVASISAYIRERA
jgi:hypothetical protein